MNIKDLQPGSYKVLSPGTVPGAPAQQPVTPPVAQAPSLGKKLAGDVTELGGQLKNRLTSGIQAQQDSVNGKINPIESGVRIFGQLVGAGNDIVGGTVKVGLQTANAATGGLAGKVATSAIQSLAQTPLGAMGLQAIKGGTDKWEAFSTKYPRAAQDLAVIPEVAEMALNFIGGGIAAKGAKVAAPLVEDAAKAGFTAAKTGVADVAAQAAERSSQKTLQTTMEAVSPELKGQKLTQAYKDVVRGSRDITEGGVVKQQAVNASERETDVGKRLHEAGIVLKNKPVEDIKILRTALKDTESHLEDVLKNSASEFGADKIPLMNKLQAINKQMPEEFKAIKDNGKVFNSVVDFGSRVIKKSEDSIQGLRNARAAFDAQAKLEFPSAFKEGGIDLKSPAGRAVKAVRDAINDHLYETAPEGSEIKALIGREADIFRATDAIAPRAASKEGKSALVRGAEFVEKHPVKAAIGAAGALGTGKLLGL